MDCVYVSLRRRPEVPFAHQGEVAEVLGILWAQATPKDGLEHISGSLVSDRVDLLLYLLPSGATSPAAHSPLHRASALLARAHQRSPALHRCYLQPAGVPGPQADSPGQNPALANPAVGRFGGRDFPARAARTPGRRASSVAATPVAQWPLRSLSLAFRL